jgi:hypothetical protein
MWTVQYTMPIEEQPPRKKQKQKQEASLEEQIDSLLQRLKRLEQIYGLSHDNDSM